MMSGGKAMLIAQISDLHIGFDRDDPDEPNLRRLKRVLRQIAALDPLPDMLIASGDLTEHGDEPSYRRLAEALAESPVPVHCLMGNHDARETFRAVFTEAPGTDFLHYVVDDPRLRCIMLDTLEPGRHGGGFCADRAAWLVERLAEAPDQPTLVFLHHPPEAIGIPWMDPAPAEPWITRLTEALATAPQVVALAAGHVHRPTALGWEGMPLTICPSTAPEVGLVLAPIDPERPDDRALIEDGEPGFALHCWTGSRLVTHFGTCPEMTLARFDDRLQPLIRMLMAERTAGEGAR